jgi:hypothetical protein
MSLTKKIIALVGTLLAVGTISTDTFAFSKQTVAVADSGVRRLLRLMDRDMNGTVSKDEFFHFMSQRFDRLDVNRNGRLELNELRPMKIPNWIIRTSPTKAQR